MTEHSQRRVENLSIRASGPATTGGRISLTELSRISSGLQATLERIAYSLLIGQRRRPGRFPKEIADAVRMDFVGFREGSAVLDLDRPQPETLDDLLSESFEVLETGIARIQADPSTTPPHFNPSVVSGLITMCGGISARNITEISFESGSRLRFKLNAESRASLRKVQKSGPQEQLTIVGRLHMGDFDPLSLRCRIDTHSGSINCDLDDDLRDTVLDLLDSLVIASGVADLHPDGVTVRILHLTDIEEIETSSPSSLDELARQQAVGPVDNFESMRGEPIDDFDDFMAIIRSAR
ncbi:hypothetical protein ACFU8R_10485 [Pseudonocardia alni]|uniref:hypothetical protein n=1 Tax=Pseudonocardia alni TaxID=33907 RepID=UPI00369E0C36